MEPRRTPKSVLIHQDHENRLTRVEVVMETICTSLSDIKSDIKLMRSEMKQDIQRLDAKIDTNNNDIRRDIQRVDTKIDMTNNKMDSNFKWLLSIILGSSASILGVVAHVQHWI